VFYKANSTIVASTGIYSGVGIARSPKQAHNIADNQAWAKLAIGDSKANYCSGIAAEHTSAFDLKTGKKVYEKLDI
jgi:hypothetical protein